MNPDQIEEQLEQLEKLEAERQSAVDALQKAYQHLTPILREVQMLRKQVVTLKAENAKLAKQVTDLAKQPGPNKIKALHVLDKFAPEGAKPIAGHAAPGRERANALLRQAYLPRVR